MSPGFRQRAAAVLATAGYALEAGWQGVRRHAAMSVASMTTLMAALLALGSSFLVLLNLRLLAAHVEGQLVAVAYLREGLSPGEVRKAVEAAERVGHRVVFVTREEALRRLQESLGVDLRDLVRTNPLPDTLEVYPSRPGDLPRIVRALRSVPGVEEVVHGGDVVDRVLAASRLVRWAGGGATAVLGVVAVVVIMNTLRLAIHARRPEIEIMRLVGATEGFIRAPFLVEGILHGGVAALLALGVLGVGYVLGVRMLTASWPIWPVVPPRDAIPLLAAVLLAGGVGIAGGASAVSTLRLPRT
ncbi:MAG: permease-like cell division protein FtsX [Armatimonadota bacterium]|nr:permease-like cell division protein FtsX [Armatimonadota bacterium]MDR7569391.1 permease-like cell division protein FtsX [Armatimonadota bacterium]MDR7614540.1 permease-like cell division protein FtsX [Armatimonadota bacterium]